MFHQALSLRLFPVQMPYEVAHSNLKELLPFHGYQIEIYTLQRALRYLLANLSGPQYSMHGYYLLHRYEVDMLALTYAHQTLHGRFRFLLYGMHSF